MAPPTFSPDTGGFVTRAVGKAALSSYRGSAAFSANNEVRAHAFGLNKLGQLTAQTGCAGIRAWYGIDSNNRPQLYLVAIDSNGEDILTTGNELVLDVSTPCPQNCPTTTSLET
jgi:hypothetical protein